MGLFLAAADDAATDDPRYHNGNGELANWRIGEFTNSPTHQVLMMSVCDHGRGPNRAMLGDLGPQSTDLRPRTPLARRALRWPVLHRRHEHRRLLPADLPGARAEGSSTFDIFRPPPRPERQDSGRAFAAGPKRRQARPHGSAHPASSPGRCGSIGEGALDGDGVDALADRLGMTARHLRRLFLQHLGATPLDVAHTRRLHFAKKLLDETTLAFNQVAFASGFGSVRRFNSQIRRTYARTPTELRRLARQHVAAARSATASASPTVRPTTGRRCWPS